MNKQDFTTTIVVEQSPEEVFKAVSSPQSWWSGEIEGTTDQLGGEFVYRYKELHMSRQKIVETVPFKRVAWLVTESQINYAEDKKEWTSTKIVFDIRELDGKTELRFTHIGLIPLVECFESCSNSWTRLIHLGLFNLITRGKAEELVLG